jgi:hypothetical protein
MSETRDVIVKLLSNIGGRKEVEQYLRQYSAAPQQRFAVIAVAGDLLADQRETVPAGEPGAGGGAGGAGLGGAARGLRRVHRRARR